MFTVSDPTDFEPMTFKRVLKKEAAAYVPEAQQTNFEFSFHKDNSNYAR
jgi:hypothetical protein